MAKTRELTAEAEMEKELDIISRAFGITLPDLVEQIKTLLASEQEKQSDQQGLDEAITRAHQLRGSAGAYGFTEVSLTAGILEDQLILLKQGIVSDTDRIAGSVVAALHLLESQCRGISRNLLDQPEREETEPSADFETIEQTDQTDMVLLVDDDPAFVNFVRTVLTTGNEPTRVISVDRLAEARLLLEDMKPDVLLLDLGLPDSQGLNTFLDIRERVEDIPVLILSALNDTRVADRAVACGAQDYLIKSRLSKSALRRCVRYAKARFQVERSAHRLRAIEDFTATLAHDLKVPVQAMERITRHILVQNQLPDEMSETMRILHSSNQRVLTRLEDLLELYSLEFGSVRPDLIECDITSLLEECIESKRPDLERRDLSSELTSTGTTPFLTDSLLLKKIVLELIENACKFADPGSAVSLDLEADETKVSLTVTSRGQTIPKTQLRSLFKSFWRGTPGVCYVPSTGTGLYYCNQIARILSGSMSCTSNDGTTSFKVLLRAGENSTQQH
ncbi:MAG: response regulator [Cyanobacteria bacterium HKST-UBA02]|nr:response regulator [Cyanobacteria bacterium HKST-UBA02]